jgi:hypothetical protein
MCESLARLRCKYLEHRKTLSIMSSESERYTEPVRLSLATRLNLGVPIIGAYMQAYKLTGIFLLKNPASPTHAVALRLCMAPRIRHATSTHK